MEALQAVLAAPPCFDNDDASSGNVSVSDVQSALAQFPGEHLSMAGQYICVAKGGTDEFLLWFIGELAKHRFTTSVVEIADAVLSGMRSTRRFQLFNRAASLVRCVASVVYALPIVLLCPGELIALCAPATARSQPAPAVPQLRPKPFDHGAA